MFMEKNRGYGLNNLYRLTTVHALPELSFNLHCVVQRAYALISFSIFQDRISNQICEMRAELTQTVHRHFLEP